MKRAATAYLLISSGLNQAAGGQGKAQNDP